MDISVGSIVRVPLGGRRVRGWVTGVRHGSTTKLKEVIGVSGAQPIFSAELLHTLRWAAVYYVSPLAAMIPKAGPPNLPKTGRSRLAPPPTLEGAPEYLSGPIERISSGARLPATFIAGSGPWHEVVGPLAESATVQNRSVMVVVPTAGECAALADQMRPAFGSRLVTATSSAPAAARTTAWSQLSRTPGTVIIGTPEVALWPLPAGGLAVVVEPGRRAMKARQTPTVHVREMMRRRAKVEKLGLALVGHTPTLETAAAGTVVAGMPGRVWPLVEVIDRGVEAPSSNPVAEATRAAIGGALRRKEPVFVFVSRRGYAAALRCTSCGELRRCPQCGSNPGPGGECERCGSRNQPCTSCGAASFAPLGAAVGRVLEELRRTFGDAVGGVGHGGLIEVGTERDIPPAAARGLAVVVDVDSMLLRPHYRAEEDTLRILTRVAATVRRGRGHRCVIQTRMSDHRVLASLRHGRSEDIVSEWLREREAEQLPPYGELLAIELTGDLDSADDELRNSLGSEIAVFGPGEAGPARRWLIQAPDLRRAKIQLRSHVQNWRDRGLKVRVDADPLDV